MITVNLKDLYYWCKEDVFVEITEEMLEAMKAADRQESAYKRRTYYHRAHYTLDMGDGIANECVTKPETPEEIYIKEETTQEIEDAIENLTEAQKRRLRQRYFEGMKIKQIADMEGVNHSTICYSLRASLKSLKKQTQIKRFRE
ncbi:RNA polymerase sigma factor [Faecalispora sporosphaeroides]|uniref:RNA polymerase sigma factor n=1 Tax=Faecalispora sporosphaeroides TaxID=1549 RepID=UPI000380B68C|nr:sigma-70 family RNA polymerase sigma factor [Faecalispora sporosphaeroides]